MTSPAAGAPRPPTAAFPPSTRSPRTCAGPLSLSEPPHTACGPPKIGPLPSLYISHGAPMLFEMAGLDDRTALVGAGAAQAEGHPHRLRALGVRSAQPSAAASPANSSTTSAASTRCTTRCGTTRPAATELAQQVAKLMPDTEPVHEHRSRGLDHGAWVPLKIMYPDADIPVLQLSMPTHNPERLLDLGRRLRPLRKAGVLVIGSGYMTHGLPFIDWSNLDHVPGWSSDFDTWAADALARGDVDELAGLPHPRTRHAVRPPHRGAFHAAVRHARRRHRPDRAAHHDHRRLRVGQAGETARAKAWAGVWGAAQDLAGRNGCVRH